MDNITYTQRYFPHEISTRVYAVKLYRSGFPVAFVCRRYHISKSSLMRWNKRFDGTRLSLADKSHKPHAKHPLAHTDEEIKWIRDWHRRNPTASICEMYGRLRANKGYSRHPGSLYRVCAKLGITKPYVKPTNKYRPKPYHTPEKTGVKWQIDVKYVPRVCYVGMYKDKFYQYTAIDEASRERFIYPFMDKSALNTVEFIKRAIVYFGYAPRIIQTDNGSEFAPSAAKQKYAADLDRLCEKLGIEHKLIRPRTPRHNGKVERSHRIDQECFYNYLSFYSYEDLKLQMKRWMIRYNNTPKPILNWLTPLEKRHALESAGITRFNDIKWNFLY